MEGTCLADGEVCLHKTHWAALCCDKVWLRMGGWVGQTLTTPLYSCSKLCPADEAREGGPSIQGHLGPPSLVGRFFDVLVRPKSEEVTIVNAEI